MGSGDRCFNRALPRGSQHSALPRGFQHSAPARGSQARRRAAFLREPACPSPSNPDPVQR